MFLSGASGAEVTANYGSKLNPSRAVNLKDMHNTQALNLRVFQKFDIELYFSGKYRSAELQNIL